MDEKDKGGWGAHSDEVDALRKQEAFEAAVKRLDIYKKTADIGDWKQAAAFYRKEADNPELSVQRRSYFRGLAHLQEAFQTWMTEEGRMKTPAPTALMAVNAVFAVLLQQAAWAATLSDASAETNNSLMKWLANDARGCILSAAACNRKFDDIVEGGKRFDNMGDTTFKDLKEPKNA